MEHLTELGEDVRYKYSFKHESLIYWPQYENYVMNNDYVIKYKEELLKLYQISDGVDGVHFSQMKPQMIKKAVSLTNQVIFEVTEKCNLSCAYCGLGDTYKNVSDKRCQNMNWKTAKTVLDYFIEKWKSETPKNFKKFYIGFHGGEPLLNMQLVRKIIRYIERNINDLNFCYAITTNGTLLLKHIDYLVEKKFLLNVSMDGDCGMNSYRVYKNGKEVYKDLYANLKKIQEEYPVFFKENIDFLSVAHSRNTNIGITSFFKSEFGKGSEIHLLSSHMVADYKKWDSMRRKTEDFNMEDRNNYYLLDFMKYFSGNSYNHYRSLLDNSRTVKTPTGTCLPFSYRVFITVRKDIIACERIGFERTLGKVTNKEVELDFERIANFYNKILDKFRIQCESCLKKESCTVCFLCNEQYFEENFVCEDFYSISDFKKCVVESLNTLRERAFKTSS